jgi:hypothetical protein
MDLIWIVVGVAALLVVVFVVRAALRSMTPKVPTPAAPTTAIPVVRASPPHAQSPATTAEIDLPATEVRAALPPSVAEEIDRLVAADQPIAAIKLLREHSGYGLKESKHLVESWPGPR